MSPYLCYCLCHPCMCCQHPIDQACADCYTGHARQLNQPPNWVVIRPGPDLPAGFMPAQLDGQWLDLNKVPLAPFQKLVDMATPPGIGVARPTGPFETPDSDGAVAEVWEIDHRDLRQ